MIRNKYKILCTKALLGELSRNEKITLNRWLKKAPENQKYFDDELHTWEISSQLENPAQLNLDNEWNSFIKLCQEESGKQKNAALYTKLRLMFTQMQEHIPFRTKPYRLAVAMISIIVIFMSVRHFFMKDVKDVHVHPIILSTANKQHQTVTLPDGSEALLNSGTTIRYSSKFSGSERLVYLSGEAFFSVKKNQRPFIVVTDNAKTKVLGTKFNVWARNNETRVFVKNGSVQLEKKYSQSNPVILTENEIGRIKKGKEPVKPVTSDPEKILGWIDGTLVFKNTPLYEVISELERYYDAKILIDDSSFKEQLITATFNNMSFQNVIESIHQLVNIEPHFFSDHEVLLLKNDFNDELSIINDNDNVNEIDTTKPQKNNKMKFHLDSMKSKLVPPTLKSDVTWTYPTLASERGIEGKVELELFINAEGKVTKIFVKESPVSKILKEAAINHCKEFQFEPARHMGKPVNVWLTWSVDFVITDSGNVK